MQITEWQASLEGTDPPAKLTPLAEALWWEARGDWDRAHTIAQDLHTPDAAWVHAYLHRREGDAGNATYWYRQAGKPVCRDPLETERNAIVEALLRGKPEAFQK